ncbi:MAG: zf-HC2 domain-containing protein [Ignavibacteriales bacterium]|nr:zf-HC2 domain-containing protein [Ignavibacteriales bacterium]MBI3787759.1 zf-HC2 domain-containing protein [Ignavibacteriales bacterium]
MNKHNDIQNSLYDYIRGELDHNRRKEIESHLSSCDRCYAEYQILKEGLRLFPAPQTKPSAAQPDAYWHNFALTVEQRIQSGEKKGTSTNPLWETIESFFTYRKSYVAAFAGGMAVVLLALLLWPSTRLVQKEEQQLADGGPTTQAQLVNDDLNNYLRKSKNLFVGITNIKAERGDRVDLSVERNAARSLIQQARYLDQRTTDVRAQQLIHDLEKILIELANMEEHVDLPDVELLRTGIHQENMLFKIRMAEERYNAPKKNSDSNNF